MCHEWLNMLGVSYISLKLIDMLCFVTIFKTNACKFQIGYSCLVFSSNYIVHPHLILFSLNDALEAQWARTIIQCCLCEKLTVLHVGDYCWS